MYRLRVGTIDRTGPRLTFTYDGRYAAEPNPTPLSLSMPVSSQPYTNRWVEAHLRGLLPDHADVRQRWAAHFGVRDRDTFGLIRAIADRLRRLRADEGDWLDDNEHWSLAGGQGKFTLARAEHGWARARVNLPCPPARLQCSLSSSQSPSSARSRRRRSAISWSVYGSSQPLPARAASAWSSVTYTAPPAVSAPIARISPKVSRSRTPKWAAHLWRTSAWSGSRPRRCASTHRFVYGWEDTGMDNDSGVGLGEAAPSGRVGSTAGGSHGQ